ncbi:DUF2971 domain-containing protein [Riemerella anatipestifer]|uniref:DUF2971 domain-containing protein n=1 Tax=Riemerella anatipestifer TaxID=34085 RepID=UPI001BD9AD60|nr:DUF2971 domain-containing protein [Riemerella anatipestifer]MBT0563230.1 DUF2971 domain-containing protein [Riemerella anatipestifer]QZO85181.1 DUF2971 domain-containing protein [Riemerella anatipestifer]
MSKIYHYTKLSTAIEFILPTMTLRTNFLNRMNGPKENQRWAFGGVNIPYRELYPEINLNPDKNIAHFESQYQLGEDIKAKIQAICFVYSDKYYGYENEMMWAQYAENHHGICLEIDTDLFLEENKDINIFKFQNVNYNPKKKNQWIDWNLKKSKEENIYQHIERNFEELFLSKSHYWEKEFEKRLIIIEDDYCFLKIKKSLTGIYYGLFTNHNYDKSIQQFINPEITKLYKVYFEDNRLKRMERRK